MNIADNGKLQITWMNWSTRHQFQFHCQYKLVQFTALEISEENVESQKVVSLLLARRLLYYSTCAFGQSFENSH